MLAIAFFLSACSADAPGNSGATQCSAGTERCPCYGNQTCDEGLLCASNVCVALEADGGEQGAAGFSGRDNDAGAAQDGSVDIDGSEDLGDASEPQDAASEPDPDAGAFTGYAHELFIGMWAMTRSCDDGSATAEEVWEVRYDELRDTWTVLSGVTGNPPLFDGDVLQVVAGYTGTKPIFSAELRLTDPNTLIGVSQYCPPKYTIKPGHLEGTRL
jgi:hypothetical protein